MTEKQYGIIPNWCIYENIDGVEKWLKLDEVCNLLNELVEEKEYYQIKSGKCEEELLQLRRDNEQLKKQIGNLEHTRDFADEVCADCERLENENEQLKEQEKRLYKYFRKCFDNVSEQGFRETWEVVKKYD